MEPYGLYIHLIRKLDFLSDAEKFELSGIIAQKLEKIKGNVSNKISRKEIEAAVVYITAKEKLLPIFPGEIMEEYGINKTKFYKAINILKKYFKINSLSEEMILFLISKRLGLPEKLKKGALDELEHIKKMFFGNPYVNVAAALYLASKRTNEEINLSRICKLFGISRQSVILRLKELLKYLQ